MLRGAANNSDRMRRDREEGERLERDRRKMEAITEMGRIAREMSAEEKEDLVVFGKVVTLRFPGEEETEEVVFGDESVLEKMEEYGEAGYGVCTVSSDIGKMLSGGRKAGDKIEMKGGGYLEVVAVRDLEEGGEN